MIEKMIQFYLRQASVDLESLLLLCAWSAHFQTAYLICASRTKKGLKNMTPDLVSRCKIVIDEMVESDLLDDRSVLLAVHDLLKSFDQVNLLPKEYLDEISSIEQDRFFIRSL
jgi:hypothetical protein